MSISREAIDAMIAAGATAEVIAAAWKADLKAREDEVATRRAKAAERKRKSRSRHGMSHDVTRTVRDEAGQGVTKSSPLNPPSLSPAPLTLPPISPLKNTGGDSFSDFWQAFPKKTGQGAASTSFANAQFLRSADPAQIVRAAKNFAAKVSKESTEERFIKNPAKWLDEQCYLDPDLQAEPSKPLDLTGWEPWQREASKMIGEAAVASWLLDGKREGQALILPTRHKWQWVKDRYANDLRALGISEIKQGAA